MKTLAILSIALLADATTITGHLRSRQLEQLEALLGLSSKAAKAPIKFQKSTPEIEEKATREIIRWGPFTLQPSNGTHENSGALPKLDPNSDTVNTPVSGICNDCTALYAQARITMEDGSPAGISTGVYEHHVLILDSGRKPIPGPVPGLRGVSMARIPMSSFVGQGSEGGANIFAVKNSPIKTGFLIGKDDKFIISAELVNYKPKPTNIYLELEYEYLPGHPAGYIDAVTFALNLQNTTLSSNGNPGNIGFKPPTDRAHTYASIEFPVTKPGYILYMYPHLHDGGVNIQYYVNDKAACTSEAVYGGGKNEVTVGTEKWETIRSYTPCDKPVEIKAGDKLRFTALYDLTKHRPRPSSEEHGMDAEGMAIARFMFAPK